MTKPDLIVSWPDTIDFPLFSKFINEERHRFEKVIVVFTPTNWGPSQEQKIMDQIEDALFLPAAKTPPGEDWRNFAVNRALKRSFSPWIWFTEQDFFPKEGFWEGIEAAILKGNANLVGIIADNRFHPCSLFIKRSLLEKTSKDFSAKPEESYDHFGKIAIEVKQLPSTRIELIDPETYYHMAGLTHNLHLLSKGETPIYKPDEFYAYLDKVSKYQPKLRPEAEEFKEKI